MKRIFIALAILLTVQLADAQTKSPADIQKAVESAEKGAAHPKKSLKAATWIKVAEAYIAAFNQPYGNAYVGGTESDLKLLMTKENPTETSNVTLSGEAYKKVSYVNKNLYYAANGVLSVIEVTKPVYPNSLEIATNAYAKAYEVDAKKSKAKDISVGYETISAKYLEMGMSDYVLGNLENASKNFENAATVAAMEPLNKIDSAAIYNAGFTAWMVKDYARAKTFFQKSVEVKYYEEGEVYAKLADCNGNLADTLAMKTVLEDGFVLYPANQSILIGLINLYLSSGDDTDRLFELLDIAKKNEPTNASLYYVEGNIRKDLGQKEEAIAAYAKANEVDPEYAFGLIGMGILYYDLALDYQTKAQEELDDNKYNELVDKFETELAAAFDPFEKAYEVSKDESIKRTIAEYLKNICYRFREKDAKFEEGFKKYDAIVKGE